MLQICNHFMRGILVNRSIRVSEGPRNGPQHLRGCSRTPNVGQKVTLLVFLTISPTAQGSAESKNLCTRSLLRELDHGPAALPRGSEVVLFNQHGPPQEMAQRADIANMDNVRITHVRGNPSNRRDLAQKINIPTCASLAVAFVLGFGGQTLLYMAGLNKWRIEIVVGRVAF